MTRLWYSKTYDLEWEGHVFPASKYRVLAERLAERGLEISEPPMASRQELLAGHSAVYLDRLEAMTADPKQGYYEFEAPCTQRVLEGFCAMAGGTLAAARAALDAAQGDAAERDAAQGDAAQGDAAQGDAAQGDPVSLRSSFAPPNAANLGGGFHHAFPDKGEGFCAINDIVVALQVLLAEGRIERAAVVDLDVHQGNGTAKAFENEPRVFTMSMHQQNNYPVKQRSDLDVGLDDACGDDRYLAELERALPRVVEHAPELVIYVAGADPYAGDRLGGLSLTKAGLRARDAAVFAAFAGPSGAAVVVCLAGGYSELADVVDIHEATVIEALALN